MKGKILIVDDQESVRQMLRAILEDDHEIWEAASGAALQEQLSKDQPDVVLLDVKLPDDNGLDLLPIVKKRWPETEVIILTGAPADHEAVSIESGSTMAVVPPQNQFAVCHDPHRHHRRANGTPCRCRAVARGRRAILADAGISTGMVSVAVVDDPAIHRLNREFLQHDYPTDVLSFLLERDGEHLEGEVIVSSDTAGGRLRNTAGRRETNCCCTSSTARCTWSATTIFSPTCSPKCDDKRAIILGDFGLAAAILKSSVTKLAKLACPARIADTYNSRNARFSQSLRLFPNLPSCRSKKPLLSCCGLIDLERNEQHRHAVYPRVWQDQRSGEGSQASQGTFRVCP